MNQVIKKGIKVLLEEASLVIDTISVEKAKLLLKNEDYVFVDLRDFRELQREGKIPGAFSCPRGMLEFWIDPESPYHKEIFNQNKTYVFYCASAWRSALSGKAAVEMGLSPVCHIEGGFSAWKKATGEIEEIAKKP
jgi:rhodanese-related sulfurtransferase